jgi:hypothetical protein
MRDLLRRPAVYVPTCIAIYACIVAVQTIASGATNRAFVVTALGYSTAALFSAVLAFRTRFGPAAMLLMGAVTEVCIWMLYRTAQRPPLLSIVETMVLLGGLFGACAYNEWKFRRAHVA